MIKRHQKVGIIAEDYSDVDSARILIHRIANNEKIGIRRVVGKGCGRIRKKCHAWSKQLRLKGCSLLVLIHDLDDKNLTELRRTIGEAIDPCPITLNLICIPVHELEAWLLSDPNAIRTAMHLRRTPKVKFPPETINSPKEYLGELIYRTSNGEKLYINTKHNSKIATEISIDLVKKKCPSFLPFYDFFHSNLNN